MADAPGRTFTVPGDGDPFAIPLPFDPRAVFGRANAPVVVQVGAITYRSTVTSIGGDPWVPFRSDRRAASGLVDGQPFVVTLTPDTAPRTVDAPDDLRAALDAAGAWAAWEKLSFTHQREHVEAIEGAKKPETRERRIAKCVAMIAAK